MIPMHQRPLDIVIILPGKDDVEAFNSLLGSRHHSLGIATISFKLLNHPRNDPGVFHEAPAILRAFLNQTRHALAVLDHRGSGQEDVRPGELEEDLRQRLSDAGWGNRAQALVIEPELESWIWSASSHVSRELGWGDEMTELRAFLTMKGFWARGETKPHAPKKAYLEALRERRRVRSSSILANLASNVGVNQCQDPAFLRLKGILREWFPKGNKSEP